MSVFTPSMSVFTPSMSVFTPSMSVFTLSMSVFTLSMSVCSARMSVRIGCNSCLRSSRVSAMSLSTRLSPTDGLPSFQRA